MVNYSPFFSFFVSGHALMPSAEASSWAGCTLHSPT